MEKFSLFLNYIAATILALIIFLGLYIVFDQINSNEPIPKVVNINLSENKSNVNNDKNQIEEFKKVLTEVKKISGEIQKRQNEISIEKNETFFDKIYTAIIAIVIAITGFFGFKSITDIKERAIKDAKNQAEETAKSEFSNIFTTEYKAAVAKEVTEIIMSKVVKDQIEMLEKRIFALESGSSSTDQNNDTNNPKNPFEKK